MDTIMLLVVFVIEVCVLAYLHYRKPGFHDHTKTAGLEQRADPKVPLIVAQSGKTHASFWGLLAPAGFAAQPLTEGPPRPRPSPRSRRKTRFKS